MTVWLREDAAEFLMKSRRGAAAALPTGARITAMGRVLEGRGDEPVEKADALSPDEPTPAREPCCPSCGRIFKNPGAFARHQMSTGHGAPKPRPENAEVARGEVEKADLGFALTKSVSPEKRYALGILYAPNRLDAHSEWATSADIHDSVIAFNRGSDKRLRKQHDPNTVIGEVVECYVWPFAHDAELIQPDGTMRKASLPPETAYVGAIFTPDGWAELKSGKRRGFSMGGSCIRLKEAPPL